MATKQLNIEEKLTKLQELASRLEGEKMTLKESLELYEEAMKLSKEIENELKEAVDKVKIIQEEK